MIRRTKINYAGKALAFLFVATLAIFFTGDGTSSSLAGHYVLNNNETLTFPARSSDLDEGAVWSVSEFSEGCCTLDLVVRKYSEQHGKWVAGTGSSNDQTYTFNVPIYAPASGRIASCWRNFPDDPSPGVEPPNNDKIFTGGNHVVIITDDNNAVSINHLKSGTIRPELCPRNNDNTTFPSTMDKEGAWRVAAYIEPADQPRIREGEYIGRAGNSGNSSGPHLHTSVAPVTGTDSKGREALGDSVPFRFRQAWGHRFEATDNDTPDGWYRLRGGQFAGNPVCSEYKANSPECGFRMIHASPYLRRADASDAVIKKVDTLFLSSNRVVTAVIDSNDKLKLISWDLVGLDKITRRNDVSAGVIKDVRIVEAAPDYVLVAVRGQLDELKLIAYHVGPTGFFSRVAEYTAGKISALAMVTISSPDKKTVTAVRDEGGNLKLIVWDLQFSINGDVSIARLGQAKDVQVSSLAMATALFNGVFTAVRDGAKKLLVIPWRISADGLTITKGDTGSAGEIKQEISVAALKQGVAVAVIDNEGALRVKTWETTGGGDITAQRATIVEGAVSEIDLLRTPHSGSNLTAVVRDSEGKLRLIGLLMNGNGSNLRRIGTSKAGPASLIAAAGDFRSYVGLDPRDMILTALRDSEGKLKLITWDTNLNNP